MIKQLNIQNFQSHKGSSLDFDPGVNIIVGSSDSGKTAIIRALRWVAWNRPSGDSIRSHWGGKTVVELLTDNAIITRIKDKQDEYILGDTHFTAFRTDVPEEITKALNLSEINLQTQLEAPFLLSETPGSVAQHFNKVAKLDKIDTSLQNIAKWIREITSEISFKKTEKERLAEELKKFDHLEKFEIELEVLEEENQRWLNKILASNSLDKLIRNIKGVDVDIQKQDFILGLEKDLTTVLALIDVKRDFVETSRDLMTLVDAIVQDENVIADYEETSLAEKTVVELLALYKKDKEAETDYSNLGRLVNLYYKNKQDQMKAITTYESLQEQFDSSFPDTCPLCGTVLKK